MQIFNSKYFWVFTTLSFLYGCMVTSHSEFYQKILNEKYSTEELGKAKFIYGDMGGIYPHTLNTNAFVYKIAIVALKTLDSNKTKTSSLFAKYGFVFPEKISNWQNAPMPDSDNPFGLIFGKISGTHPLKGKYYIETADLGCGSCHGGILYGKDGTPTNEYFLGIPNTSLNLQQFADELFEGYKIIVRWNEEMFVRKALEIYPEISKEELTGMKLIFSGMKKEVKKIIETRGKVAPYKIGGPGSMNGIGAIKRGFGLIDNSVYNKNEVSLVSIPALVSRSFRSSFLVCGNYAPKNHEFFYEITAKDTNQNHDREMAHIISLFTIGTMGYDEKMANKSIPDVKDVMQFISKVESPTFPGEIDSQKVEEGKFIFQKNCQSCHGKYEGNSNRNKIVSFPNQLIPLYIIQTDSVRAVAITNDNFKLLNKIAIGKYFDARVNKGYVAPILSGVWATAPYLHNGSVPTLWHLMHPESRPEKFYVGGHQLDFEKMGIKGELKNGVYQYPDNYKNWCDYEILNTKEIGLSNSGHIEPFDKLTEKEKDCLLEFFKTL